MTKQELMEIYTAEQLAEMVVDLQNIPTAGKINCEDSGNSDLIKVKCDKCGEEFLAFLDEKYILCKKTELFGTQDANEQLNKDVEELQSDVEKYRKAFEDAKKKCDCQIYEYQKKIDELTAENEKLKGNAGSEGYSEGYIEKQIKTNDFYGIYAYSARNLTKDDVLLFLGILTKELVENGINFNYDMGNDMRVCDITIEDRKTLTDFHLTEPIKVADMLINTHKRDLYENSAYYSKIFNISELRQIAEHLLIYCNANKEQEHNK